ncbi:MAG: M48 family metallopeptidase [Proteobacteria bacterium]|nr:MAG: M48 family metallopeptidase [Pseudomonadota bacterium]
MRKLATVLIFSSVITSCGALEWKDKLLSSASNKIPWSFENAMGDQLLPSILPPDQRIDDPNAQADLEALLLPITSKIQEPRIKVHISKDPALNAFAIPGGHLIFNKGMLLAAESPEEILGVAAHEIAHATERHVMRSMIQGLSLYAVVTLFMGDVSGVGAYLIHQGQALLETGFSRKQERQADAKGVENLINARIDPRGMIRFFERIQKEAGPNASGVSRFLSTHPLTSERIDAIDSTLKSLPAAEKTWKPLEFNLKEFQNRL